MKSKISILLLVAGLVLALFGCGEDASVADIQKVSPYKADDVARSGAVTFPPSLASLQEALSALSNDPALSSMDTLVGEEGSGSIRKLLSLQPRAIEAELDAKIEELKNKLEAFETTKSLSFSMSFTDQSLDEYWLLQKAALNLSGSVATTDGAAIGESNFKSGSGEATAEVRIAAKTSAFGDSIIKDLRAGLNAGLSASVTGKDGQPYAISAQLGVSLEFALSFKNAEGVGGIVVLSFYARSSVNMNFDQDPTPNAVVPSITARIALYNDSNGLVFEASYASMEAFMEAMGIEFGGEDEEY